MRPPLAAVSMLSAAAIGYEILLTRLFSIILWHHFAYLIISVALLGVGASGTFLAFARRPLAARFTLTFATCAVLFGIMSVGGFALAQRVPFNPLELVWDVGQQFRLLQISVLLAVPFFAAATAIGLTLARFGEAIGSVYRADMVGAGLGALGVVLVLMALPPAAGLRLVGALGLLAAALAVSREPGRFRPALLLAAAAIVAAAGWPGDWLRPQPSQYKGLSQALTVPGARVAEERSGPLGLLTVVESPEVPFRHVPGLSLAARVEPPPQLGVFTDAESLTAIARFDGDLAALGYLDQQTAALPFHLLDRPRTLVLGAGGGADVLLALHHEAEAVDAVELNPQLVGLVRDTHAAFAGHIYARDDVTVHVAEARAFVETSTRSWDVIQVALLDSFTAAASGLQALSESPLYTVEALRAYSRHLAPGGILAITRWLRAPPRDSLKLIATAIAALEAEGVADPGRRLAAIRGWNTVTVLLRNGSFEPEDVSRIRSFAGRRAFDVAWYPGMTRDEANRRNRLAEPYLFDATAALLERSERDYLDAYRFYVAPATDDRPYYFRFFKWSLLPELLALRGQGGLTLLDSGYLILLASLAQAVATSLVLILLPMLWLKRRRRPPSGLPAWRIAVYFLALGFAFMFVEIAFIQRLTLFLGHPLGAIAIVLAGFLLFAGLGSGASARWSGNRKVPLIGAAIGAIAGVAVFHLLVMPIALPLLTGLPISVKAVLALAMIAPLAFPMGMPFPLGLAAVTRSAPALVPWAWAINGCASVVAVSLASLLAMHIGFAAVIGVALALYAAAALIFHVPAARQPAPARGTIGREQDSRL